MTYILFDNCFRLKKKEKEKSVNRPYSRYPPSLHVLKDWRDISNITWFFRGQTSAKIANTRNRGRVSLFFQNETIIFVFLNDQFEFPWVVPQLPSPLGTFRGETSPAAKSKEKRMFSQASVRAARFSKILTPFQTKKKLFSTPVFRTGIGRN